MIMTEKKERKEHLEQMLDAESLKDSTQVVVFDLLDTLQGYIGADYGKNKEHYLAKIAEACGMSVKEMLDKVPEEQQESLEYVLLRDGGLVPRMLEGVEELLRSYIQRGIRPVVFTGGSQESAYIAAAPIIDKRIIRQEDVHGIGTRSKKIPETWRGQLDKYIPGARVVAIYEDAPKNLEAAMKGYGCPGYLVKETPTGIICSSYLVEKTA